MTNEQFACCVAHHVVAISVAFHNDMLSDEPVPVTKESLVDAATAVFNNCINEKVDGLSLIEEYIRDIIRTSEMKVTVNVALEPHWQEKN